MSMAANRENDIRAGLVSNNEIARLIRQHNNANVLVLPGRFMDEEEAKKYEEFFAVLNDLPDQLDEEVLKFRGVEADDILAYMVKKYEQTDEYDHIWIVKHLVNSAVMPRSPRADASSSRPPRRGRPARRCTTGTPRSRAGS